jgi:purine nucleosidase
VTATAGTVSGVQATRNLHYLIGLADPLKHPRVGQSDLAITPGDAIPQGMPTQTQLNGRFGLGDVEPNVPDLHNRRESAKLIVDVAREYPQEVRLLTLGPLTNVAMAIELDPELPMILNGIVCLGGAFRAGGDVTATSEFNVWSDALAARTVMSSPVSKTLVPLDVSQGPMLTFEDIDRLGGLIPSTPIGELVTSMMHYAARSIRQHLPREGVALPAIAALTVAARIERFTFVPQSVDIETEGRLTAGMTVLDQRPLLTRQSNVDVITHLDDAAIVDFFCRSIRRVSG